MSTTDPKTTSAHLGARDLRREARRVIASSFIGSTIEYYDFLLYATATALVFPHVFFTNLDPLAGAIASAGTFAAGYIARPLGGAVFGHFGDRLGRKKMLVLSMVAMGSASTLIGLVPGQASIGSWGAIILIVLRVLQGIAIGGEWGGAALMALEHAKGGRRGFAASFTNAGAPMGAALGTTVMGLANHWTGDAFLEWGWRIPFVLSVVLLAVGVFIRSKISESPIFREAVEADRKQGPPAQAADLADPEATEEPDPGHAGRRGRIRSPGGHLDLRRGIRRRPRGGPIHGPVSLRGRFGREHPVRGGLGAVVRRRRPQAGDDRGNRCLSVADLPDVLLVRVGPGRLDLPGHGDRPLLPRRDLRSPGGVRVRTIRNHRTLYGCVPGVPVGDAHRGRDSPPRSSRRSSPRPAGRSLRSCGT
jgi:hypothetical protein